MPKFLIAIIILANSNYSIADELIIGNFSALKPAADMPNWQPLTFDKIPRHSQYELIDDDGSTVLAAVSENAASGLTRKIEIDPQQFPIIKWRWRVNNIIENGDVRKKSGDDYAARIYITFKYQREKAGAFERAKMAAAKAIYGEYPPVAALNYIWANRAPQNSITSNAYTKRVKMIAVQSGNENARKWHNETRNILKDYQAAFGKSPPPISGIAIMTDTDNTKSKAHAYFGDIIFESK